MITKVLHIQSVCSWWCCGDDDENVQVWSCILSGVCFFSTNKNKNHAKKPSKSSATHKWTNSEDGCGWWERKSRSVNYSKLGEHDYSRNLLQRALETPPTKTHRQQEVMRGELLNFQRRQDKVDNVQESRTAALHQHFQWEARDTRAHAASHDSRSLSCIDVLTLNNSSGSRHQQ